MPTGLRGAETALGAIERAASAGIGADELLAEVGRRIERVVPSDGYFLAATDPQTTLCIGAGVVHNLPADQCRPTWDYEFLVPDFLKFADIAWSGQAVADLHEATGGRPNRSARWREYGSATGFRAELRTTYTLGGGLWGVGQFDRLGDAPRFSEQERTWLGRVAPAIARGLRRSLVSARPATPADRGPGVVLLDNDDDVISATSEAAEWLDELQSPFLPPKPPGGVSLPIEAHAYAARVRAVTAEGGSVPRARLRTRAGVWMLMHGSMLDGTDQLALVIEPAKAADVAPLIVEAYELTHRELDVTRLIAQGCGTSQIAGRLHLSPHTVRDHLKAVFEKTGVSSRGELVAKVFADHYAPAPHAADER